MTGSVIWELEIKSRCCTVSRDQSLDIILIVGRDFPWLSKEGLSQRSRSYGVQDGIPPFFTVLGF